MVMLGSQRQQHGGQAFVTGGHTHDAFTRGQRADQAAHDDCGVVAIGQAVEHAGRALRAPIARIGDKRSKRDRALRG